MTAHGVKAGEREFKSLTLKQLHSMVHRAGEQRHPRKGPVFGMRHPKTNFSAQRKISPREMKGSRH